MKIIDCTGNPQDAGWLRAVFGEVRISDLTGPGWYVSHLVQVARNGELQVRLLDADGPVQGMRIAFYWPDAPDDPNAGPAGGPPDDVDPNRCVHTPTDPDGLAGFQMGRGARYNPKVTAGPHALWVRGRDSRSQVVTGLGQPLRSLYHLDVTFTWWEGDPIAPIPDPPLRPDEPIVPTPDPPLRPDEPPDPVTRDPVLASLDAIKATLETILNRLNRL